MQGDIDVMETLKTGWERNRRTHFDDVVSTYDNIRPEYPEELFSDLFNYANTINGNKAIEIGAGTGKATTPILNAGFDVTAVEIGKNMAALLLEKFKSNNNFRVIVSAFEDTSLEENNYDLIYAATAFHWVDAEIGCPKVLRLLKNGGVFALFRYNAVPAVGEELYEEIQAVYEKHYYTYYVSKERPTKKSSDDYKSPEEIYRGFRFNDMKDYGFNDVSMKLYESTRTFTADEYMLMFDTISDHRALPDENRALLYTGIKEAILKHGGYNKVDYIFQLYMGRKFKG